MSILEVLVIIVVFALGLAAVLGAALAIGWTTARLRIWWAEACFVQSEARRATGSEDAHA